ncbi:GNAT family N-acetyltransferase [Paenibacillus sp. JX-17]|uniref:GNAT family N-acetyltransferase n=1 Tax=Paenibacillus lacisoli TaxID=3064525 RepID=A0ABT9CFJ7_9BACL|nr:GNAT family N-acetyltransferase [Paenibacillus sp. JX-17]MDO7907419.1 GNAT family N-acetyltransferase [Paenibacillus sp. JX-17]
MKIVAEHSPQIVEQISSLLHDYNQQSNLSIPAYHKSKLILAAYEQDEFIGGITGQSVWGVLHIQLLGVVPSHRSRGIGASLLAAMEDQGRESGCKVSELTTMSWQAPSFYQKHGYHIVGEIKDVPAEGMSKLYLMKSLV